MLQLSPVKDIYRALGTLEATGHLSQPRCAGNHVSRGCAETAATHSHLPGDTHKSAHTASSAATRARHIPAAYLTELQRIRENPAHAAETSQHRSRTKYGAHQF